MTEISDPHHTALTLRGRLTFLKKQLGFILADLRALPLHDNARDDLDTEFERDVVYGLNNIIDVVDEFIAGESIAGESIAAQPIENKEQS